MKYLNKGKRPKGGQYLQCSKARLGDGCTNRMVRYDIIEERILNYCWELDVTSIMPDSHEKRTKINQLRERDQAINGQLSEIEQKLTNIYQAIEQGTNPTMLTQLEQRHSQLEADKNELLQEQQTLHTEIETLTNHEQEARQQSAPPTKDIRPKAVDGVAAQEPENPERPGVGMTHADQP